MKTVHIIVIGSVQGVFYRRFAKQNADILNLKGYAKNLQNGNVEIVVKGNKKNIESFIKLCKKGPVYARVEKIVVKEIPNGDFSEFSIRY